MGLFDKFKKNKSGVDWNSAYKANPHFYSKPDGNSFCAFALTEDTETIFCQRHHITLLKAVNYLSINLCLLAQPKTELSENAITLMP